jgi:hypothetical protein
VPKVAIRGNNRMVGQELLGKTFSAAAWARSSLLSDCYLAESTLGPAAFGQPHPKWIAEAELESGALAHVESEGSPCLSPRRARWREDRQSPRAG